MEERGGEDVMAKQRIWLPSYVYVPQYVPWSGYQYYAYPTWQEYEVAY